MEPIDQTANSQIESRKIRDPKPWLEAICWREQRPLTHSLHAGLKNAPTTKQLEQCLDDMNAGRPQCPVGLHTLVMPSRKNSTKVDPEAQPFVYLNCGHVQGRHAWGAANESGKRTCPICLGETDTVQLKMGSEAGDVSAHCGGRLCGYMVNPLNGQLANWPMYKVTLSIAHLGSVKCFPESCYFSIILPWAG